ncbi:unnamed protein product [Phytomonas sp. EM1]|nr:unnamed protein product [Phytomonas sp. EM1]|eukprot:CCW63298.1 unnamed protein product [Phytomonas sp. isolate EM1]
MKVEILSLLTKSKSKINFLTKKCNKNPWLTHLQGWIKANRIFAVQTVNFHFCLLGFIWLLLQF